jgi:phage baseplate assembly protein W
MSGPLSDYNYSKYKPVGAAGGQQYSDLDFSLRVLPSTGDVAPLTDIDAVKNSIKNLCLTGVNERPFQPGLGSRIRSLLFENANSSTAFTLKQEIETTVKLYEPRVSSIRVDVKDNSNANAYNISVTFSMSNYITSTFEFIINRLR